MSNQATFKIELMKEDGPHEVTVRLNRVSPLIVGDIMGSTMVRGKGYLYGEFLQLCIEKEIIVSPKNLVEQINESDNGVELLIDVFGEVNAFVTNPRVYIAKAIESEAKSEKQE